MKILQSISIFILAGLCEIGGGYMIWLWLREQKHWYYGVAGGFIIILYGIVASLQRENFGRVFAGFGGIFFILAILWGWKIDGFIPDKFDIIGGLISLIGMGIIMFAPRN